ncbi:MAG: hypothetical protein MUO54_15655 [Anaerolineales bacterium]|nr:hypothetical protein [Anaerolineales bacterium]
MSIIPNLASSLGRRDEEPNKELGKRLVDTNNLAGIQEAAANLNNENRNIQIDCLAVLEQVGRLAPELIENYLDEFLKFIVGKDNRLIWAAMINIALIADKKPEEILDHLDEIIAVIDKGSVITKDNGIKILARAVAARPAYTDRVFPYLIDQLNTCRPKSLPQYSESILVAVSEENKNQYLKIIKNRSNELTAAQAKRINEIIKGFE